MASWRPALGILMVAGGLVVFSAGGLYDAWWSWVLGTLVGVTLLFGGIGVFFTGLMEQ